MQNFCNLLWTLSLSRMFVEFFLKPVYSTMMVGKNFQIYGIYISRKCVEAFLPMPPSQWKLSSKFLSSPSSLPACQAEGNYSFPIDSAFSKIPQQQKGMEETLVCFIKIQSENLNMTWNISFLYFVRFLNFSNVAALGFFK